MEPEGLLPPSQASANNPYPEPQHSSTCPASHFLKIHFSIVLSPLHLGLSSGLFPSGLPAKTLYALFSFPIRATCPAHLILLDLIPPNNILLVRTASNFGGYTTNFIEDSKFNSSSSKMWQCLLWSVFTDVSEAPAAPPHNKPQIKYPSQENPQIWRHPILDSFSYKIPGQNLIAKLIGSLTTRRPVVAVYTTWM